MFSVFGTGKSSSDGVSVGNNDVMSEFNDEISGVGMAVEISSIMVASVDVGAVGLGIIDVAVVGFTDDDVIVLVGASVTVGSDVVEGSSVSVKDPDGVDVAEGENVLFDFLDLLLFFSDLLFDLDFELLG
jgi:hypothetical protein